MVKNLNCRKILFLNRTQNLLLLFYCLIFLFSCNGASDKEILLKDIAETNKILVELKQKDSSLFVEVTSLVNEAKAGKIANDQFTQQFRALENELSKNEESKKVIENELTRLNQLLTAKTEK